MKLTPEQEFLKAIAIRQMKKFNYEIDFSKPDWFHQISQSEFIPNEDHELLDACKKYLASLEQNQSTESTCPDCNDSGMYKGYDISCVCENKIKPQWKPEVGKLYTLNDSAKDVYEYYNTTAKNVEAGEICELIGKTDWSESIYRIKTKVGIFEITDAYARKYLTPIAELEGLEEGDRVWSVGRNGSGDMVCADWEIEANDVYNTLLIVRLVS